MTREEMDAPDYSELIARLRARAPYGIIEHAECAAALEAQARTVVELNAEIVKLLLDVGQVAVMQREIVPWISEQLTRITIESTLRLAGHNVTITERLK